MPTARELLEQADALMRRNRNRANGVDESIPVLTDSVSEGLTEAALHGPATRERASAALHTSHTENHAAANAPDSEELALALDRSLAEGIKAQALGPAVVEPQGDESQLADPPVLTDAVEEVAVDLVPLPAGQDYEDAAPWLGPDTVDPALHSITGPAPDTVGVVPPMTLKAEPFFDERFAGEIEPAEAAPAATLRAVGSAPTPAPAGSAPAEPLAVAELGDEDRWHALAEQVSMQVLQRLDLFVDTGLKARLAAHLQPIVERAGTELVEAINDHVGQLVRTYVAEAIEREIAQWRQGQR
ncbi:MAG TPA: hypothetical protein VFF44_11580 [Casimicrobiaceae bacterium]|nr:hypothetical protein [Casimicrobiaceae bacterium]